MTQLNVAVMIVQFAIYQWENIVRKTYKYDQNKTKLLSEFKEKRQKKNSASLKKNYDPPPREEDKNLFLFTQGRVLEG